MYRAPCRCYAKLFWVLFGLRGLLGAPAPPEELVAAVHHVSRGTAPTTPSAGDPTVLEVRLTPADRPRLAALLAPLAFAHGWSAHAPDDAGSAVAAELRPRTP